MILSSCYTDAAAECPCLFSIHSIPLFYAIRAAPLQATGLRRITLSTGSSFFFLLEPRVLCVPTFTSTMLLYFTVHAFSPLLISR
jgi:hypothetical protein